jgi:dienelactone hydrolase
MSVALPVAAVRLALLVLALGACAARPAAVREVPIQYQVGPYEQVATLHEPALPQQAKQPALVLLHGGFFGARKVDQSLARDAVGKGALVVVPAYRGQKRLLDGERAEGPIEFCGGEVDDALELMKRIEGRDDVDARRIGLLGFSHGGCVALRVAEAHPGVRAVVAFSAPTDAAAAYRHLRDEPLGNLGFNGWLASRLRTFVGGEPQDVPERWAERSPLRGVEKLDMTLLLVHGLDDDVIPPEHACWLRDALRRGGRHVIERRFTDAGQLRLGAGPACGEAAANPKAKKGAPPAEVWFYEGQGHGFSQPARRLAYERALRFLVGALRKP